MRLLILFCLCVIVLTATAQNTSTLGKEFYVSFSRLTKIANAPAQTTTILLTSSKNTSGTIQNINSGFTIPFSIAAGKVSRVDIPLIEGQADQDCVVGNRGLFIQANDTISAFALIGREFNSEAAVLIPVTSLGTEYMAASYGARSSAAASYVLIIATSDNTDVEITPSTETFDLKPAWQPFTVTLDKGQSYYLTNSYKLGADLSGSRVSVVDACKPIAVFSGSEGTYVPNTDAAADALYEQLFPINSFGKAFLAPAFRGRNVYIARVFAAYDNTVVDVGGGALTKTLNANEYFEFVCKGSTPSWITTSKPAQVAAYGVGQKYDVQFGPANQGDPTMMLVPPVEQNLKESVFLSPDIGVISSHRLCIFAKTTDAQKTVLDNQNVGSSFIPVDGNPVYSFATFDVAAGQHVIKNDGGFLAYSYGFGNYQGYGYCTGSSAKNIETYLATNGITSLSGDTADACIKDVKFDLVATLPDSAYSWDFGDGSAILHTAGNKLTQKHLYQQPGIYQVKLTRYIFNAGSCNINGFTLTLPVRVVNSITPTLSITTIPSTMVCAGTQITFVTKSTGGGTQPIYQWKVNGVNAGTNNPAFASSTLLAGDQVTCVFTSSLSCAGTAQVSASVDANVFQKLSPTVAIKSTADSLCIAAPVTLSATTNITTAMVSYQWLVNGKDAGSNLAQFTYIPSNAEEVYCQVSVTDSCGNNYQAVSNRIKMTVAGGFPKPAINISTTSATICDASIATFTATITNPGSNPVYQWQVNGQTTGDNKPFFSSNNLKNGDVIKGLATTTGWCPTTSASNAITISVLPRLTPGIEISSPNPNVCQGEAISFLSVSTNGGNNPSFQWQVNGINTGVTTKAFNPNNLQNGDVVSCIIAAHNLCQTDSLVTSKPIAVSIKPVTTPTVAITPSKNPICSGEQVVFKAAENNAGTGFSYQWNLDGNDLPNETGRLYTSSRLADGDKIICKIISGERCTNDAVSNQVVMIVHPMPTVGFDPGEVIIYAGTSFKMAPIITGDIASYRWTPSTYLSDPTVANPVATPGQHQYYTLDVSTAFGCKASSGFQIKVFRDVIMPNAFTPNGDGTNDVFRVAPIYQLIRLQYLIVYNRWGEKVFESKDVNKGWDGKQKGIVQPSGNFIWVLAYENPITGQLQLAKGSVVLIR